MRYNDKQLDIDREHLHYLCCGGILRNAHTPLDITRAVAYVQLRAALDLGRLAADEAVSGLLCRHVRFSICRDIGGRE